MKIGIVCPYNLFKGGGVQECVLAQHAELTKRGHEVRIITPKPRSLTDEVPEDVRFLGAGLDVKTPFHTTAQVSGTVRNEAIDQLLDLEKFDVLHFHEPWISAVSRQLLSRSKARNIATFHAKLPENTVSRTIEKVAMPYMKAVLKYLDDLTAVSEPAATYLKTLTTQQVHIIPNGVDLAHFSSIKRRPKRSIVYIGRLEKRKGVKYLLQAYAELSKQIDNIELVIAGAGPDRAKLEELATELELERVKFMGYITNGERKKLLSEAGVFCSPALYGESFGIVLLEAMAAGAPVVAGDNPGYSSVMKGRGMLALVSPQDTLNFARRLELMLFDEELQRLFLNWAQDYVKQFDYSLIVDQYEKLYRA